MSISRFLNMPLEQIKRSNPQELVSKFEGVVRERNMTISKTETPSAEYNWLPPLAIGLSIGLIAWVSLSK